MKTEKEKMLSGEMYDASDSQLTEARLKARDLCHQLNTLPPRELENKRSFLVEQLLGAKSDVYITPPFYCDYGTNISVGKRVYFNFNCVVLDAAPVQIGDNVLIGPNVQLLTASHPIYVQQRRAGLEFGESIEIGNDVWIGGGAILCPGVTVGEKTVIGAGSVVTKDIPPNTLAAGNPCKVIRSLV